MDQDSSGSSDRERQVNEIITAYLEAVDAGQTPDRQEWLRQYPEFAAELEAFLAEYAWVDRIGEPSPPNAEAAAPAPPESAVSREAATMDYPQPTLAEAVGQPEPAERRLGWNRIVAGLTILVLASMVVGVVVAEYLALSEQQWADQKKAARHAGTQAKNSAAATEKPANENFQRAREAEAGAAARGENLPGPGVAPKNPSPSAERTATVLASVVPASADVFHMPSGQTSLQFVTVGDPGNVADTTGFGAVLCVYRIGKYNVTTAQYIAFLNAVATTGDPYGLYTSNMASDTSQGCGISRSGSPGSYRYSTAKNDNFPVNYVSWGDAARFCNWLQNGQPTGAEGNGTTETGAYTLNGKTNNLTETRKPGAAYFIPTENEWYKAAYYKGGGTNAGYWWYTTRSNAAPINTLPDTGNHANYKDLFGTGNKDYTDPTNRLTSVGCFALSPGPYGTYDMGGDVAQWNESVFPGSWRGLRGGDFYSSSDYLRSSNRDKNPSDDRYCGLGFRVATVPEAGSKGRIEVDTKPQDPPAEPPVQPQASFRSVSAVGGRFVARGQRSGWSPDGKKIVFGRSGSDNGILIYDIATKETTEFASARYKELIYNVATNKATEFASAGKDPAWAGKDGRWIAYVIGSGAEEAVRAAEVPDGKQLRVAAGCLPSWSSDGKTLFFQAFDRNQLMSVEVTGGGQFSPPRLRSAVPYRYPAVSPDGKRVAYKNGGDLVIQNLDDGKVARRFVLPPGIGVLGGWSPDNREFGFGGWNAGDPMPCIILDVESGLARQVASRGLTLPAWSPDGTKITFDLRLSTGTEIWMIDAAAIKRLPTFTMAL